jgi:hypothetical protein
MDQKVQEHGPTDRCSITATVVWGFIESYRIARKWLVDRKRMDRN